MRKAITAHPKCVLKQTYFKPNRQDFWHPEKGWPIKVETGSQKEVVFHLLASSPPEPLASPPLVLLAALVTWKKFMVDYRGVCLQVSQPRVCALKFQGWGEETLPVFSQRRQDRGCEGCSCFLNNRMDHLTHRTESVLRTWIHTNLIKLLVNSGSFDFQETCRCRPRSCNIW